MTLIANGADINQASNEGATPLIIASQYGHSEIVEVLLKNKADPNSSTTSGTSPLIVSIFNNFTQIVALLLKYGSNRNHVFQGCTALEYAVKQGKDPAIIAMLQSNINAD